MAYTEPSWLTEPPEDTGSPLSYCEYCNFALLAGDTVYYSDYDSDRMYCSEECFDAAERKEKELQ